MGFRALCPPWLAACTCNERTAADRARCRLSRRARAEKLGEPRIVLVPGFGVLVHRQAVAAVEPMARCLADVTTRIGPDEPIRALPDGDVDMLVNWDAEKYRQSLARTG